VAAISVPQAMAYALIAGVDPRFGLYSAIVVTAVASVFGSSSHLINGPTNAISLVVFSALATFDPDARLEVYEATFLLGIMVGCLQIVIAVFRLGDLTRYISESVVLGFMAGAGFLIALSQVSNLLGMTEKGRGAHLLIERVWLTVTSGQPVNGRALAVGLGTVAVVLVLRSICRRLKLPRVDMLITLAAASAVVAALGWSEPGPDGKSAVAVVGAVRGDFPTPHIPDARMEWVQRMAGGATAIALLGLLEALAIAKSIAATTRQRLDFNQQCLAEGLANLAGGFFRALPGSGSLTRSAINFQAGAVSRLSGVIAAAAVALAVVLFGPSARFVPRAALAGLLLVTAHGLVDWPRLRYALRASRYDASLVLVTALSAVFVSVELSILIGVGLSIVLFIPRAARLRGGELTVDGDNVIRDRRRADPPVPGMVLYNLEGELFFGAAPELERLLGEVEQRAREGARVVVLRVKRTRNPDAACMEQLEQFLKQMQRLGATVLLCGVREDFARAMENLHFDAWLPSECVFREEVSEHSATLKAVRRAYELLGRGDPSATPPSGNGRPDAALYYMI
jgi:SulP family sulfate permease